MVTFMPRLLSGQWSGVGGGLEGLTLLNWIWRCLHGTSSTVQIVYQVNELTETDQYLLAITVSGVSYDGRSMNLRTKHHSGPMDHPSHSRKWQLV